MGRTAHRQFGTGSAKPAVRFDDVKDALSAAIWIYQFGREKGSISNTSFKYGIAEKQAPNAQLAINYLNTRFAGDASKPNTVKRYFSDSKTGLQFAIFAAPDQKRVYVAFRGSQTDELVDWEVDGDVMQKEISKGICVHEGFYNVLNDVKSELNTPLNALLNNNDYEVIVTGHSLGGALCTMFGYMTAKALPDRKVKVISFASPRVGNEKFRDDFQKLPNLSHFRVVNNDDAVTGTPNGSLITGFYFHANTSVIHFVTKDGENVKEADKAFTLDLRTSWEPKMLELKSVPDHSTELYWQHLQKCKW